MRSALEKDDRRTRKIFLGVFYVCATAMAVITFYAMYVSLDEYQRTGRVVIGEVLVDTEWPFPGVAKLVTYLMIVSVVAWYCVVRLGGDKVSNIPKWLKSILQLVVLMIAVVALYEFVYNFIVWNSFITADVIKGVLDFDNKSVEYPNPETPWNLVFATKMSLAAFLIAAHGFYTMSKPDRRDHLQ
ncbi:hypothetical protein [Nitrososphaera viennensis]|uniref:Uncharacterized protein n=2 Tax=Nitrososphaera viennensis TaxID=1034015 RepID=A0A060HLK2_9ARCH|nr:hypothetical protein [Nitrososphaera viennensis]AIC16105.1 hypothetical protein NVIE_018480 [Nitrososphaera viennensis EN76]UVS68070.1 hypothetical protein NWT39_09165 [Nitrososphaera viennensis]